MCGFAGIARTDRAPVTLQALGRMAAAIRHRGPDGYGFLAEPGIGLAHVRLSIVDPAGGAQPMTSESGDLVVVFNGEIYNHADLRRELAARGHRFRTACDTEVLVHGFEEWREELLPRLDGQFAFALYERSSRSVYLVRDRFGVRPLFHAQRRGSLVFGSEVKALAASGEVELAPDPRGIDEVFTFWAARPPRTPFHAVSSLEPGSVAVWRGGRLRQRRYYRLDYPERGPEPADSAERLDGLLRASVAQRLLADVPVGAYLSGGLDSSVTTALASSASDHPLRSFSIAFDDAAFDESRYQREVATMLGTEHRVRSIGSADIAEVFPEVVRHAETPLVRTAPAPMYLLSRLARDSGIKVVLTGEGADELFLGYDLFKETAIRRFCLRAPGSSWRPRLFARVYPYFAASRRGGELWARSFLRPADPADPLFSHLPRFAMTARIGEFHSPAMRAELEGFDAVRELREALPERFSSWHPLHRAAWLEMETLLGPYLLASQGDRMGLAHGVEGRFPFLDHRLFEFTASLPASAKLRVLQEKDLLRRWARPLLPGSVLSRPKQPYLAPAVDAFFGARTPDWVEQATRPAAVAEAGIFEPRSVARLLARCAEGRATGFAEGQALVAVLSTQLWHQQFISAPAHPEPLPADAADVLLRPARHSTNELTAGALP